MPRQWKDGLLYVCGEYDVDENNVHNLLFVMQVETDLRGSWESGKIISVNYDSYVLTERKVDKKTRMVTYKLKKLSGPESLEL